MKWEKKGMIFCANGQSDIMNSHATSPSVIVLEDRLRVFFTSRSKQDQDGNYISYPTYIDLDIDDPKIILDMNKTSLLELGEPGCFDEHGIMVYKTMWFNNKLYMYYGGWQRLHAKEAPYRVSLGLAISSDNGKTFEKYSKGPVMSADIYDALSIGSVYPLVQGRRIYLYYTTYNKWISNGVKATPDYSIKLAISEDGINWKKDNVVIVESNEAGGVATPTVFEQDGKYKMIFGYRRPFDEKGMQLGYSLGYAESQDLITWNRDDEKAGIKASDAGWDSEMICYPHVVQVKDKYLMFYSGNGYGVSGFGYAELVEEEK